MRVSELGAPLGLGLPPTTVAICISLLVSQSFQVRFGLWPVPTTHIVRGFPDHFRSSSPDTVSTNLENQRDCKSLLPLDVAVDRQEFIKIEGRGREPLVRLAERRGCEFVPGAHLRPDVRCTPIRVSFSPRGTREGSFPDTSEIWTISRVRKTRERVSSGSFQNTLRYVHSRAPYTQSHPLSKASRRILNRYWDGAMSAGRPARSSTASGLYLHTTYTQSVFNFGPLV